MRGRGTPAAGRSCPGRSQRPRGGPAAGPTPRAAGRARRPTRSWWRSGLHGILLELGAHVELAVHDNTLEEPALQALGPLVALAVAQDDQQGHRADRNQPTLPEQVRQEPVLAGHTAALRVEARAVRDVAQRAVRPRRPLLAHLAHRGVAESYQCASVVYGCGGMSQQEPRAARQSRIGAAHRLTCP
eukprot:scaffold59717_cov57-Phaeocystis_antarctica.AAC.2